MADFDFNWFHSEGEAGMKIYCECHYAEVVFHQDSETYICSESAEKLRAPSYLGTMFFEGEG